MQINGKNFEFASYIYIAQNRAKFGLFGAGLRVSFEFYILYSTGTHWV